MTSTERLIKLALPFYKSNDPAHRLDHAMEVMIRALEIGYWYFSTIDGIRDKFYIHENNIRASAILHDVGIGICGRKSHHISSGAWVQDYATDISQIYDGAVDIPTIYNAVREHRASYTGTYSTIVSAIVSCADRHVPTSDYSIYNRAYDTSISQGMHHVNAVAHAFDHVNKKYGKGGYSNNNNLYLRYYEYILKDQIEFIANVQFEDVRKYLDEYSKRK